MSWLIYDNSALIERGDDATRTVTTYPSGDTRPYTQAAVKEYQAALGLTVDGIAGTATQGALMSLQDDIKALSKKIDGLPKEILASRVPTPAPIAKRYPNVNASYSVSGLLANGLYPSLQRDDHAEIIDALNKAE